jgi:hypothetical protein
MFIWCLERWMSCVSESVNICMFICFCRTLDDMEMYDQQQVFSMQDYVRMSEFLNLFVFRVIWNNLIGNNMMCVCVSVCLYVFLSSNAYMTVWHLHCSNVGSFLGKTSSLLGFGRLGMHNHSPVSLCHVTQASA